jgi:hypothetical protein
MSISSGDSEFSEKDFFDSRIERRLYISKQFVDKFSGKKKRFAYKKHNSDNRQSVCIARQVDYPSRQSVYTSQQVDYLS